MSYPITELYAWIVDDPSGEHGLIGFRHGGGPLVQCATSERRIADKLENECQQGARNLKLPIKLQRFVLAETIKELVP